MDEYIKREQVLKLLESAQGWNWSMNELYDEIQALPTEDVLAIPEPENEKISEKNNSSIKEGAIQYDTV